MSAQEGVRIIDAASDQLGEIASELQQGQIIEEDDALGRRIVDLTLEISSGLGLIHDHLNP